MATIKRFEDLEIWQLARTFNKKAYPLLKKLDQLRMFGLKSQLDNSAGSVMDNIEEGFEREGNGEFIQHLSISKGSLGESRSQLYRAFDRDVLEEKSFEELLSDAKTLAAKIATLMAYLNNSTVKGHKFATG
jgi:four helix bundle protein